MNLFKNLFKGKGRKLSNEPNFTEIKTITRAGRGELFRGNSVEIYHEKNVLKPKGSLVFSNCYYSGGVNQRYDMDENKTITSYSTHGRTAKWLQVKLIDLGKKYIIRNCSPGDLNFWSNTYLQLEDNPCINVFNVEYNLIYNKSEEGPKFNDHYENIQELKHLNLLWRQFRNKLKSSDVNQLADYVTTDRDKKLITINKNFLL